MLKRVSQLNIFLLTVNNKNSRKRCGTYLRLTIKTTERRQQHHPRVFIVTFEHVSHLSLVFLLLTFTQQVNVC